MLKKLYIKNLYNQFEVNINFNPEMNIIIGVNGMYKTTILNIIEFASKLNTVELFKYEFDELNFEYYIDSKKTTYKLSFDKDHVNEMVYATLDTLSPDTRNLFTNFYSLKGELLSDSQDEASNDESQLRFDSLENEGKTLINKIRRISHRALLDRTDSIKPELINSNFNVKYLPINRLYSSSISKNEPYNLDIRIQELIQQQLDKVSKAHYQFGEVFKLKVIETVFSVSTESKAFQIEQLPKIDMRYLDELQNLLVNLKLDSPILYENIANFKASYECAKEYFEDIQDKCVDVEKIRKRILSDFAQNKNEIYMYFVYNEYQMNMIFSLIDLFNDWKNKEDVLRQKERYFLEKVNDYFAISNLKAELSNNRFIINRVNALSENTPVQITRLSSGESHLLNLFANVFLDENSANSVLMIDEPELSLHLDWQKKLLFDLIKGNSGMQIIVATHSPDILSDWNEDQYIIEDYLKEIPNEYICEKR